MKVIGITGGIGTGKSTVLKLMKKEEGVYIIEADKLAHHLMLPDESVYEQIIEEFGTDILMEDGSIDRRCLGAVVFKEKEDLKRLNRIVHPAVKEYILKDIEEKKRQGIVLFYVIEAALLIEDGYKSVCDELWFIYAKKEERIRRLLLDRGGDRQKWEQIIQNQSSEESYLEHCDVVIDNGGNLKKTVNVVKELLSKAR